MDRLTPKEIPDEEWEKLTPQKSYAVLCGEDNVVYFKLGVGKSFYLSVRPIKPQGRVINSIQYEDGDESVVFKLPENSPSSLGRGAECTIKIIHPIISRKHIEFTLWKNILVVKDWASTNGSYFYARNVYFSIDDYIQNHPVDKTGQRTLDEVHQTFGPHLDDFLIQYTEGKDKPS